MAKGLPKRVPNADNALFDDRKVTEYLLSDTHPVGMHKARVFRAMGFSLQNWTELKDQLLSLLEDGKVVKVSTRRGSVCYEVVGMLDSVAGPGGRIRSIWHVEEGTDAPKFITAMPE